MDDKVMRRLLARPNAQRDYSGYGATPPHPQWPRGALLAINFVLNYEEGAELDHATDGQSDRAIVEESINTKGLRDVCAESQFEYGSRVGFYRIMALFAKHKAPLTVFACARALEASPGACAEIRRGIAAGSVDVCGHGLRWQPHFKFADKPGAKEAERTVLRAAAESFAATVGTRTQDMGWYTKYAPSKYTRELLAEEGWMFDCDSYSDELPYWAPPPQGGAPRLVIPYTLTLNDGKFNSARGQVATGEDFFQYIRGAVDQLIEEARDQRDGTAAGVGATWGVPKMISVGLHNRLIGHPARARGLAMLLEYVAGRDDVWLCRRGDIARHWIATHPPSPPAAAKL